MNVEATQARERAATAKRDLKAAQHALAHIVRSCQHDYTDPVYKPIVQEAYTIPGDAPGTMGVDFRGPCHVPRKETPQWMQTCRICGTTRTTIRTKDEVKKIPQF